MQYNIIILTPDHIFWSSKYSY